MQPYTHIHTDILTENRTTNIHTERDIGTRRDRESDTGTEAYT